MAKAVAIHTPDGRAWMFDMDTEEWFSDAFRLQRNGGGDPGWSLFHNDEFVGLVYSLDELEATISNHLRQN